MFLLFSCARAAIYDQPFTKRGFNPDGSWTVPIPDFTNTTAWSFHNNAYVSNGVLIMTTNGRAGEARIKVTLPEPNEYNIIVTDCPTDGDINTDATCYIDAYFENFTYYGATANLGLMKARSLPSIPHGSVTLGIYLQGNGEKRYKKPIIKFQKRIDESFDSARIKTEKRDKKTKKYTVDIKKADGDFQLQTLGLLNAFDYPNWPSPSISLYGSTYSTVALPIIANATHIVGVDITNLTFFVPWQRESFGSDGSMLNMPLRPRRDFSVSIFIMECKSESFLDALDNWYDEFEEIYHVQPNGAGAWLPNPNLKKLFANNTDEIDIYLGSFLWGTGNTNKISVTNYKYSETSMYRIPIQHSSDSATMIQNLKNCKSTMSEDRTPENLQQECEFALKYAIRNRKNQVSFSSNSDWYSNGGSLYYNTWQNEVYQLRMQQDIYPNYNDTKNNFQGIGLDSFSHLKADYEFSDHIPAEDISPFALLEAEKLPFQSMMSGFFHMFRNETWTVKRGYAFNSNFLVPQIAKLVGSVGWEISLSQYGKSPYYPYRTNFWSLRYAIGSRAMSMLENQYKGTLPIYCEDVFLIFLSVGITPSSQPIGCAGFLDDPVQLAEMRPFYLRWGPTFRKVLNHTRFKANNKGVKYSMPQNETLNYPNISQYIDTDCDLISTFCNGGDCYTNAFLGYSQMNNDQKQLKRTMELQFPKRPACIFVPQNATCIVHDVYNVTFSMTWNRKERIYRTATIQFPAPGLHTGEIIAIAVSAVLFVSLIIFTLYVLASNHVIKIPCFKIPDETDSKNVTKAPIIV